MDNLTETNDNRDEANERLKDKEKTALINNEQYELMERLQLKLNKSREEIQSVIYEL